MKRNDSTCPACGQALGDADVMFCTHCGAKLEPAAIATASPAAPAAPEIARRAPRRSPTKLALIVSAIALGIPLLVAMIWWAVASKDRTQGPSLATDPAWSAPAETTEPPQPAPAPAPTTEPPAPEPAPPTHQPPVVLKPIQPAPATTSALATKQQPFVNSLGMRFVPVPIEGGPTDGKRLLFSIWETRVQDYAAYAAGNPGGDERWKNYEFEGHTQGPDHPVVKVSWEDAKAFCEWLTRTERASGRIGPHDEYRLPTDVEWSYGVGLGDREDPRAIPRMKHRNFGQIHPWGMAWPPPDGTGNFNGTESALAAAGIGGKIEGYRDDFPITAPVGSFPANQFGLHDLDGNAQEWCEDLFDPSKKNRVIRGGSWGNNNDHQFASARRQSYPPSYSHHFISFRCVLAPVLPSEAAVPSDDQAAETELAVFWTNVNPPPGEYMRMVAERVKVAAVDPEEMLRLAFARLLEGNPKAASASHNIPRGTRLRSLRISDDGVFVDLSREFESGGGTTSMTARFFQVIYTASSLDHQAKVWISLEGEPLTELGGEGLRVRQPESRQDNERLVIEGDDSPAARTGPEAAKPAPRPLERETGASSPLELARKLEQALAAADLQTLKILTAATLEEEVDPADGVSQPKITKLTGTRRDTYLEKLIAGEGQWGLPRAFEIAEFSVYSLNNDQGDFGLGFEVDPNKEETYRFESLSLVLRKHGERWYLVKISVFLV